MLTLYMSKKILIAEDEETLAKVIQSKLKKSGLSSDVAFDGAQALEMIEKGSYDLVLLDLMMPEVGGFDVLKELQGKKGAPKVIVTSNLGQPKDKQEALDLGAVQYLVKANTKMEDMVKIIKKHLK